MEVKIPLLPFTSLSSSSNAAVPQVRVCSQRNCERILSFKSSKSNICEHCAAKIRSRSFSSVKCVSNGNLGHATMFTPSGDVSERVGFISASMRAPTAVLSSRQIPSHVYLDPSHLRNGQHSLPIRSSVAIPHEPPRILCVPSSGSGTPFLDHFNSRGEFIENIPKLVDNHLPIQHNLEPKRNSAPICQRCSSSMPSHYIGKVCPGCQVELARPTGEGRSANNNFLPTKPVQSENIVFTKSALSVFSDAVEKATNASEEFDMEDLELSYPPVACDSITPTPSGRVGDESNETTPKASSSDGRRAKRQKIDHPVVIGLTSPELSTPPKLDHPSFAEHRDPKASQNTFRSLKLCSIPNCTGIVFLDSSATRCLGCVKRDWKSKRSIFLPQRVQPNDEANLISGIHKENPIAKKKAVTWADKVTQNAPSIFEEPESDVSAKARAEETSQTTDVEYLDSSMKDDFDVEDHLHLDAILESTSKNKLSPPIEESPGDVLNAPEPESAISESMSGQLSTKAQGTRLEISSSEPNPRLAFALNYDGPTSSTESHSADKFCMRNNVANAEELTSGHHDHGWDSDLSELTDSSNEGESEVESETNTEDRPSTSTGLKIRIPARPAGIYSQKCGSAKCNQLLSTSYRWKTCVMCRARSRHYQRKRQNLQGTHVRLDEELLQVQNMGTPLAGDFLAESVKADEDPVALVPGARLCSVRNCTYIIPPVGDYRWKMCALCRLRRRERNKLEKSGKRLTCSEPLRNSGKRKALDSASVLRSLNDLPGRPPTAGRCQSIDCGILMDANPKSVLCKQCLARQLWLVKRSGSLARAQQQAKPEKPRGPAPYPQYKCFVALLSEFKKRLSDFLRVQSIFFLYKATDAHSNSAKTLFGFDGEYSVVALDFDIVGRKEEVDHDALKLKKEMERVGRIKFNPKRLVSILEGGGVAIRFVCGYRVPILQPIKQGDGTSIATFAKTMQGELEIAIVPDHSHQFLAGQRTIIRFRLMG